MDLLKYIVKNSASGPVDVLSLGKEAAARYGAGEGSLNELIVKQASVHRMNRQQIDRVCEVANNATFAAQFQDSPDKNVTFPVADAVKVAHAAKRPASMGMEKEADPISYSSSTGRINSNIDLEAELFGVDSGPTEKTASASINEAEEAMRRTSLKGQILHLSAERDERWGLMKEAMYNFTESAFQLVASGDFGYPDLHYALSSEIGDPDIVKMAMAIVEDEVKRRYGGGLLPKGLHKRASAYVANSAHPLVQHAKELVQHAEAYAECEDRMQNLVSSPMVPGGGAQMSPRTPESSPLVDALSGGTRDE